MKLNKMLPDYKIEKAQKNIVFLLIRHSNFIKNSFCHSLTGIPHFRAITTNRRHLHAQYVSALLQTQYTDSPPTSKVQLFLVLKVHCHFVMIPRFRFSPKTAYHQARGLQ